MAMGGGGGQEGLELAGRRVEEMLHRDSEFPPLATKLKIAGTIFSTILYSSQPFIIKVFSYSKTTHLLS